MKRLIVFVLAIVLLIFPLTGCVSKSKYEELQVKHTDLNSNYEELQVKHTDLNSKYEDLQVELNGMEAQSQELQDFIDQMACYMAIDRTLYEWTTGYISESDAYLNMDSTLDYLGNEDIQRAWHDYQYASSPMESYYGDRFWQVYYREMDMLMNRVPLSWDYE